MGDAANNIYVPFQITYINTDEPVGSFVPLDPSITPCSKALNVGIFTFETATLKLSCDASRALSASFSLDRSHFVLPFVYEYEM